MSIGNFQGVVNRDGLESKTTPSRTSFECFQMLLPSFYKEIQPK